MRRGTDLPPVRDPPRRRPRSPARNSRWKRHPAPSPSSSSPARIARAAAALALASLVSLVALAPPVRSRPGYVAGPAPSGGGFAPQGGWRRRSTPPGGSGGDSAARPPDSADPGGAGAGRHTRPPRGKPISDRVTAEELYEAYSQIREEYDAKAFGVRDEDRGPSAAGSRRRRGESGGARWRILKETDDGIQIAMLRHPSDPSCPYVRMRAVMPGTVRDVWDFLRLSNWERTMPKMDPFYEGLTVLGRYTHRVVDMVLARKRTKRILTFGKRDFTFVSVSDVPRGDGVWVSGTVSVVTPKFPRVGGYTRAFQDSVAFYEPLDPDPASGEARTALTIVCRIDLNDSGEGGEGGAVPMWVYVKTIGASGALSIHNMRRQLELDAAEKREREARERRRGGEGTRCPLVPWVDPGGAQPGPGHSKGGVTIVGESEAARRDNASPSPAER